MIVGLKHFINLSNAGVDIDIRLKSGRLSRLFDLYDDLYIDGILSDSVDKRISAVTNSEITFQNAKGEEVDVMSDLIDTIDFEVTLIMDLCIVNFIIACTNNNTLS